MQQRFLQHVLLGSILLLALLALLLPNQVRSANVDFNSLPVGTMLDKQIPGITFLKYKGIFGAVVADTPSGHVASFTDTGGSEPFLTGGANIAFSTLQRTVTLHIGLLPVQGLTVQREVRATGFDAGGVAQVTASATLTAGAGFDTVLTVSTPTPIIATVVVESIQNPETEALIAIRDITFNDVPEGVSDFSLELPRGTTVLQGGAPFDVPLRIHRFAPSAGAISLSVSDLPAGVSAVIFPNPASIDEATLRLQAASGPAPEIKTLIVTGSPLVASAGPAPRSASMALATESQLRVTGPADLDFSGCAPNGSHGSITRDYWIIRDFRVRGPIDVALENLPPEVTATVTPATLDFPGWVIGQRVSVTLTTIGGLTVSDAWVPLHLSGSGVDLSFPILVHGACPQQNRNFVIRGSFWYINAGDAARPLTGAQVEIFRYRSGWFDERVDVTYTDEQGAFSRDLYSSSDGEYYARLRLASQYDAQVEDADNSSVWSIDTAHQWNRGGLIDIGGVTISRDGGSGTPRAAVWQGFCDAIREFRNTAQQSPPGGYLNVIIYRGHVSPIAWYNEVHWPHGLKTGETKNRYRGTMHEFAHVFRDVFDGSQWHWNDDNRVYLYGRKHTRCRILCGTQANDGFGFHEGWADYWSHDTNCCPGDIDNQNIEGTVAHDLQNLASCAGVGRRGMISVLAGGENLIHSDIDFRREYAKRFPQCSTQINGNISDGCTAGQGPGCVTATSLYPQKPAFSLASAGMLVGLSHVTDQEEPTFALDPANQRQDLVAAIESREKVVADLKEQQRSASGLRTFALRAAVEEGTVIVQRLRDELAEFDRGNTLERYSQRADVVPQLRDQFIAQRKAIQIRALRDALAVVSPDQRPEINRRLLLLQESRIDDASLQSMILLPAVVGDDTIVLITPSHPRWLLWIALAITLFIVLVLVAFVRLRKA